MDREVLAWHEAGHAVVASLLSCEVKTVSLRPPSCWARGDGLEGACIALAGPLAEMRRFGHNTAQHWANGWSGDAANARERYDGHLGEAIRRTDHLLRCNWQWVELVADALLKCGSLSGAEVERLGMAPPGRRGGDLGVDRPIAGLGL